MQITKAQLQGVLQQAQSGEISFERLQLWCIHNYDPPEQAPAQSEPAHVRQAMDMIMNEYELVQLTKIRAEGLPLALAFLECSAENFDELGKRFIRDAFLD
ncbi:hypothetical protein [Agaribacterium haliotis]|uniref:hypothetical protein n=1 Tax=Agaribacterium haliotis TaxID=2013869 RepID=UPI000BB59876|nr:hypothetical protein [Agaribacterium haliotis]